MRRSSFIFSFSCALAAAAALAGLDYFLARSPAAGRFFQKYSDIAFDNPLRFYEKVSRSRHEPGKSLVVVLGSSVARESVDEGVVARELGERAQVLNLGFFHARPVDLWMLADEILALRPDLIVMPVHPGETYLEYSYRLTMPYYFRGNIFGLIGWREVAGNWREFFYACLARRSFLFRYRDSIGAAVLRYGRDRLGIEKWHPRGDYRFVEEREQLPELDERLSLFGQDFIPDNGLNLRAAAGVLRKFSALGVPVVVVPMRDHPKLETELDRLQKIEYLGWQEKEFPRRVAEWSGIPGVSALRVPDGVLTNQDYADYIHLNASGRAAFSRWLVGRLKRSGLLPGDLQ